MEGLRRGSQVLQGNSYSFQIVALPISASSVPSNTISSRSRPTDPKAPYVFTSSSGSKEVFILCRAERRFVTGPRLIIFTEAATTETAIRWAGDSTGDAAARSALATIRE